MLEQSPNHQLLLESYAARDTVWQSVGKPHKDVLSFLINPSFMGAPRWPALRQAFRRIDRKNTVIVASDGLSDPFDDEDPPSVNGFRVEVFAEAAGIKEIKGSWLFNLVYQVAQSVADRGNLAELFEKYGIVSTELYDVNGVPKEFLNKAGRVGVLLGIKAPQIPELVQLPLSNVYFVSAKLLTIPELDFVAAGGPEAREDLAVRFTEDGSHHVSSLKRKSVV